MHLSKKMLEKKKAGHFRAILTLGAILLLALALRLYHLGSFNLLYDEAISVLDGRGLDKIPHISRLFDEEFLFKSGNNDYLFLYNHGFVYYWAKLFGSSEFALRISSVIFILLSIYFLYVIAKKFFNSKVAFLACFLMATSPFSIYHSQELRPYAVISFLALTAVYSFLKILELNKRRFYFIYAAANILNVYFHYMTLTVLFSFCVFLVFHLKKYRRSLRRFVITHSLIAILLTPVFLSLYSNLTFLFQNTIDSKFSEFPIWAGKVGIKQALFTLKNFGIGYNADFFSFAGWFSTFFFLMLFLYGVIVGRKKYEARLFLFSLLVPILTLFLLSQIKTCYVDRYFFPVFVFYILFISVALGKITNKVFFVLAIAAIAGINFFGLKDYYAFTLPKDHIQHVGIPGRYDTKSVAKLISEKYKAGDRIMHTCRNTIFPLKFYIRQFRLDPALINEVDNGSMIFIPESLSGGNLFSYNYDLFHPRTVLSSDYKIGDGLKNADRLWLVFSSWYPVSEDSLEYEVLGYIRNNYNEYERAEFFGTKVYLFTINKQNIMTGHRQK